MANLAQQLKEVLTERARNSESCKKYLLDWVVDMFKKGHNPVIIMCTNFTRVNNVSQELRDRAKENNAESRTGFFHFAYENGKHYLCENGKKIDITDLPDAQEYAVNGCDESDKSLFLKSEGFNVIKYWKYGKGDIMEITY